MFKQNKKIFIFLLITIFFSFISPAFTEENLDENIDDEVKTEEIIKEDKIIEEVVFENEIVQEDIIQKEEVIEENKKEELNASSLGDLEKMIVEVPEKKVTLKKKGKYTIFEADDIQYLNQTGEPSIPSQVLKILLPKDVDVQTLKIFVEGIEKIEMEGEFDIGPTLPFATWDSEKDEEIVLWPEDKNIQDGKDIDIYSNDSLFPDDIIQDTRSGQFRQWKVLDLALILFQYNPKDKKLYKIDFSNANIVVEYNLQDFSMRSLSPLGMGINFGREKLKKSVINFDQEINTYSDSSLRTLSDPDPGYIILTTNFIASSSQKLLDFRDHKITKGFDVQIVTEDSWDGGTGDTASENIRDWLENNYLNLNIEYLLLIGDPHPTNGDVPMKMLYPRSDKESPSDLYYSELTGNWDLDGDSIYGEYPDDFGTGGVDLSYEIIVGRIPVYDNDVTDLDSILLKSINYENSNDKIWRSNVLLAMAVLGDSTPGYHLGEATKDKIDDNISSYFRFYSEYYYDLHPFSGKIFSNYNFVDYWSDNKFGFVSWLTHGGPAGADYIMLNGHTANLNNDYPSFVFQGSCNNAYPEYSTNLSYSLLKNGAINALGATRVSWYLPGEENYEDTNTVLGISYKYSDNFVNEKQTSGQALFDVKERSVNCSELWMNFTGISIYGDPSLKLDYDGIPIISSVDDQYLDLDQIEENESIVLEFEVSDTETSLDNLNIIASSSNIDLIDDENIALTKIGSNQLQVEIIFTDVEDIEPGDYSIVKIIINDEDGNTKERKFAVVFKDVLYVSNNGDDGNTGQEDSPFRTIQHAISSSTKNSSIVVSPGTYEENIEIEEKTGLTLIGDIENPNSVVLDGNYQGITLEVTSSQNIIIEGFKVINGDELGVYIFQSENTDLKDLIVFDNSIYGIIVVSSPSSTFTNLIISNNIAGINILLSDEILIANSTIANSDDFQGNGLIVANNSSDDVKVVNSIFHNSSIYLSGYGSNEFSYNLFDFAESNIIVENDPSNTYLNNLENEDPLFLDLENGDFSLASNSPAIDAGDPDLDGDGDDWTIDTDDQDPDGTRMDIGAIYYSEDFTISGQLHYYTSTSGDPIYVPDATVILEDINTNQIIATTSSDSSGNYELLVPSGFDVRVRVEKDEGSDSYREIGIYDMVLIKYHYQGRMDFFDNIFSVIAANMYDNDYSISIYDMVLVKYYYQDRINDVPFYGRWKFYDSEATVTESNYLEEDKLKLEYNNISNNFSGQDFIGLKMGDVDGSWIP